MGAGALASVPHDGEDEISPEMNNSDLKIETQTREKFASKSFDNDPEERSRFGPRNIRDEFIVGDIIGLRSNIIHYHHREGLIVERIDEHTIGVDFGEGVKKVQTNICELVVKHDEFEVGDKVEVRPVNSSLYFVGRVIAVSAEHNTIDVLMEGDDLEDIERNIPKANARKLMTRREVAIQRWRRSFLVVQSANAFMSGVKHLHHNDPIPVEYKKRLDEDEEVFSVGSERQSNNTED